jgi:shikimate dehydrogenase
MHNAALKHFGLEGSYSLLDVQPQDLEVELHRFVSEGFVGFNVTIPFKEAVYKLSSRYTAEASTCGAANTIKVEAGELLAHNTDVEGFRQALESHVQVAAWPHMTACVIGAGGAARAAVAALDQLGLGRVLVYARDRIKAAHAMDTVQLMHKDRVEINQIPCSEVRESQSLIVQTTPVGQADHGIPNWFAHFFTNDDVTTQPLFFDMVYSRSSSAPTPLVQYAKERQWRAVDGTDMLVHQALSAFLFWTGMKPPFSVMKQALDASRV